MEGADEGAGPGHAVGVVAGQEELHAGEPRARGHAADAGAVQEIVDHGVVGGVGCRFGVVDAGPEVGVDVGAPHQFDGEGPAFGVGELQLVLEFGPGGFEVGLDGVVDDGLAAAAVMFAHQVDGPAVDGRLHRLLFRVDPDPAVLADGALDDGIHGGGKGWGGSLALEKIVGD